MPEGHLLLQTIRSHDQFNTTIYGLSDRYRGIEGGRRVVFLHSDDVAALGFAEADLVDIVSDWEDGSQRRVPAFRLVGYDVPRGCAAAYYPGDQPAGAAGAHRRGEQPAGFQGDHRASRARVRRRVRRAPGQ